MEGVEDKGPALHTTHWPKVAQSLGSPQWCLLPVKTSKQRQQPSVQAASAHVRCYFCSWIIMTVTLSVLPLSNASCTMAVIQTHRAAHRSSATRM